MNNRQANKEELQTQMEELNTKIDALKEKAAKAKESSAKLDYHDKIEALTLKRDLTKSKLEELQNNVGKV
jgi:predicted  nucleic acid-binding Zn-ribbon protein